MKETVDEIKNLDPSEPVGETEPISEGEKKPSKKKSSSKKSTSKKKGTGRKKKKKKINHTADIIMWVVFAAALVVFAVSAFSLGKIFLTYKEGTDTYNDLVKQVIIIPEAEPVKEEEEETPEETPKAETLPVVDWSLLTTLNKDVEGWIYFPNIAINYPIVKSSDDEYYLKRMYDGTWNGAGSIFVDKDNSRNFADTNTIIYGHNMKNGSMFGLLKNYSKKSYFEENPYFYILTPTVNYRCDIFSVHVVDELSSSYTMSFSSDEAYAKYLDNAHKHSMYDTGVKVSTMDKIVTLSTCTSGETNRLIVQAVLRDPGEPYEGEIDGETAQ